MNMNNYENGEDWKRRAKKKWREKLKMKKRDGGSEFYPYT